MRQHLWVRVGDAGDYQNFGDDLDALLDYLCNLSVGAITSWVPAGFATPNYWGRDYISLFWGDANADLIRQLDATERVAIETGLSEAFV